MNRGLISRMYKIQEGNEETNNPTKKWAKNKNREFSMEEMQMVEISKIKKCLSFLGKYKLKHLGLHFCLVTVAYTAKYWTKNAG